MFLLRRTKNRTPQLELFYRFYFTPVKNVKYSIENFVEQKTDYEKLVLK
jgi:DNA-directed RNA polymerase alpha subunit